MAFDNLGNIDPEDFKKAMDIKDINMREAAIRDLEKSAKTKELAPKEDNPLGLVKGTDVEPKHQTKYMSDKTQELVVTCADYNVNSALNRGKAAPGIISGTAKMTEKDYVGGALDYIKSAPAFIQGSIQQAKATSAGYKALKSFKNDIKDLSKADKAAAMAEYAQATANAHIKIAEGKPEDIKQAAQQTLEQAQGLADKNKVHDERVRRAERIVPEQSVPDFENMKDIGGDW